MAKCERVFAGDELTKRERVLRTLRHEAVDRVAIHEQLSFNPGVIAMVTGKAIQSFEYTAEDVGETVRRTLDSCFPFHGPCGTERVTDEDGFVFQNDNWTSWHVSRPFTNEHGACAWLRKVMARLREELGNFDGDAYREEYAARMREYARLAGETVVVECCGTRFCRAYDRMGLEIYTYFLEEYSAVLEEYMELSTTLAVKKADAAGSLAIHPVVLIAEDFATKQGPIFSPEFLGKYHFPYVTRLVKAWKEHGIHVLYHSDGNYRVSIPALMACGVDGFYCLEPNCGMDIVALKNEYPQIVWSGGVDGVDLLERGSPEEVTAEVWRHITQTDALRTGGMFIASSSEINPCVKPENFRAMIEATASARYEALQSVIHPSSGVLEGIGV